MGDPATSWREKTQVRREGSNTTETSRDEDSGDKVGTWEVAAWKRTERSIVANFKQDDENGEEKVRWIPSPGRAKARECGNVRTS